MLFPTANRPIPCLICVFTMTEAAHLSANHIVAIPAEDKEIRSTVTEGGDFTFFVKGCYTNVLNVMTVPSSGESWKEKKDSRSVDSLALIVFQ